MSVSFKQYAESPPFIFPGDTVASPGSERLFTASTEAQEETGTEKTGGLYQRAEEHFFAGRYNTSLSLFLRVLEENPENGAAHSYCGDIYLNQKNLDRAMHHFRIAAEIGPEKHKAEFRMGQIAYLKADSDQAMRHLNRSLEIAPDFGPAIFYQGLVLWKLKNQQLEAADQWDKYLTINPQDPQEVAIKQAIEFLRSGSSEGESEEEPDTRAKEPPPFRMEELLQSVEPRRGAPGADANKDQPATAESSPSPQSGERPGMDEELIESLKKDPSRLSTIIGLAEIYEDQGRTDRALAILEAAAAESNNPEAKRRLAALLNSQGNHGRARQLLREELQRSDLSKQQRSQLAMDLAVAALDEARGAGDEGNGTGVKKDLVSGLTILERENLYRNLPQEERTRYQLMRAELEYRDGKVSEAYSGTLRALKEDPTSKKALLLAARISQESRTETSFEFYDERIRGIYANDPDMMAALARIYAQEDPGKATDLLKEQARAHPEHIPTQIALAEMESVENPEIGLARLQKLAANNPDDVRVLRKWISYRINEDRSDEFKQLLKRVYLRNEKEPGSFPELGDWIQQLPPDWSAEIRSTPEKDPGNANSGQSGHESSDSNRNVESGTEAPPSESPEGSTGQPPASEGEVTD